eukprot:947223-Lingulodinium_polyedra.AAC.1
MACLMPASTPAGLARNAPPIQMTWGAPRPLAEGQWQPHGSPGEYPDDDRLVPLGGCAGQHRARVVHKDL